MHDNTFILTLAATGFSVALLHAAIPTHWLPFVMVGRARGWTRRQILAAVALAGGGHIIATTLLGIGLARFGYELNEHFDHAFHWVVAAILVVLGLWMAFRSPHGRKCQHCHGHPEKITPKTTDKTLLWGLFLSLTLSPCELFLPVYLTASPYGWPGILMLSTVLALATLSGMLTLTWLTLLGSQRLHVRWLDQLDERIIGALLCLLGIATVTISH